jgi:hypothetical protein
MKQFFIHATIAIAAMLITLLAAFGFAHRGALGNAAHPVDPVGAAHPVHAPDPHAGLSASACPANPHGVSPRPTLSAKAVIRT